MKLVKVRIISYWKFYKHCFFQCLNKKTNTKLDRIQQISKIQSCNHLEKTKNYSESAQIHLAVLHKKVLTSSFCRLRSSFFFCFSGSLSVNLNLQFPLSFKSSSPSSPPILPVLVPICCKWEGGKTKIYKTLVMITWI